MSFPQSHSELSYSRFPILCNIHTYPVNRLKGLSTPNTVTVRTLRLFVRGLLSVLFLMPLFLPFFVCLFVFFSCTAELRLNSRLGPRGGLYVFYTFNSVVDNFFPPRETITFSCDNFFYNCDIPLKSIRTTV